MQQRGAQVIVPDSFHQKHQVYCYLATQACILFFQTIKNKRKLKPLSRFPCDAAFPLLLTDERFCLSFSLSSSPPLSLSSPSLSSLLFSPFIYLFFSTQRVGCYKYYKYHSEGRKVVISRTVGDKMILSPAKEVK